MGHGTSLPCVECFGAIAESVAPGLLGCLPCYNSRVVWRATHNEPQIALTIDDVPHCNHATPASARRQVARILAMLVVYNASATFFVMWNSMVERFGVCEAHLLMHMIVSAGHEIGAHFEGAGGWCKPAAEYLEEARSLQRFVEQSTTARVRFVRPPGGTIRSSTVDLLEQQLGLTTVLGTAYALDTTCFVKQRAGSIGRCTAQLGSAGGRIAILHDDQWLPSKMEAFLEHVQSNGGYTVVTLSQLLDRERPMQSADLQLPDLRRC